MASQREEKTMDIGWVSMLKGTEELDREETVFNPRSFAVWITNLS